MLYVHKQLLKVSWNMLSWSRAILYVHQTFLYVHKQCYILAKHIFSCRWLWFVTCHTYYVTPPPPIPPTPHYVSPQPLPNPTHYPLPSQLPTPHGVIMDCVLLLHACEDIFSLDHMKEVLKSVLKTNPIWLHLQDVYPWKDNQPAELQATKVIGITSPHHIKLGWDRARNIVIKSKRWLTDQQWTQDCI